MAYTRARFERNRLVALVDESRADLAAIAAVDNANTVRKRDALLCGKAAAREHKPHASARNLDGKAATDNALLHRFERDSLGNAKVKPSIALMRIARHLDSLIDLLSAKLPANH